MQNKSQLKFQEENPDFRRHLEYARLQVHNQCELSINGHDVLRRMEGVCEKFAVCNYPLYSEQLRHWQNEITKHPLIASSDQVDLHFAIMQLLLDVARKPVDAMTSRVIRNNGKLIEFPVAIDEKESPEHTALMQSLIDIDQEVEENSYQPNSDELSDWSDSEADDQTLNGEIMGITGVKDMTLPVALKPSIEPPVGIRPPERERNYTVMNCTNVESWLTATVQNGWWFQKDSKAQANSEFQTANFANGWNKYLDSLSMGFVADKDLSTTSEYILMREIIWMLVAPSENCKFFRITNHTIELNTNVTVASCSLPINQAFLSKITQSMTHLWELREFTESLHSYSIASNRPVQMVLEIYSACVLQHIQALDKYVLDIEMRLVEQNDCLTSLAFIADLSENHLRVIDSLHQIHSDIVDKDWRQKDNHITAALLLAKLWNKLDYPLEPMENNLTLSIILPCLESFLVVFDSWWSLGQLHDYAGEFPISEWGEIRDFPQELRETLLNCPLIRFLREYCRESHVILNQLTSMHRICLLGEITTTQRSSYQEFLTNFLKPFNSPPRQSEQTQTESAPPACEYYCELMELLMLEGQVQQESVREEQETHTSKEIFEMLEKGNINLSFPYLELIIRSLREGLGPRIETTQHKVARIFLDEFKIVNHFRNVNFVLLLQSPAMYDFYTELFVDIETNYNNLSSYQLTAKLDACLQAVHPQMESMFTVEMSPHYYKTELDTILDCLTKMRVEYNFQAGEGVIDFNTTTVYNNVFSLLLQIKWGLWLLENLKYGDNQVRVKFFKEPNMLDFSIRQLGILRFWLLSSVKYIHSYLAHTVIECETSKLERCLENCTSIVMIQKGYDRFLAVIEEKCFLGERQKELQAVLQEFLHFILIFRDYWHELQEIAEQDSQLERKESMRALLDIKIDQLEKTYSNIHQCLIEKLHKESQEQPEGHGELFE